MTRLHLGASLGIAVVCATIGAARAEPSSPQMEGQVETQVEDRLKCGGAEILVQSTCISPTPIGVQCTKQRLRWHDDAAGQGKVLVHDGKLVRKRGTGRLPVLDAYVGSWACVTSDQGVSYFLLLYTCSLFDEVGRCRRSPKEWERLVGVDGRALAAGLRRRSVPEEVYRRLGLSKLLASKGLPLQPVKVY